MHQHRIAPPCERSESFVCGMQKQLVEKPGSLPFDEVILCNIGNPQSVGQKPFTFFRQVLAGCMYPDILESGSMPEDVVARTRKILGGMAGGVGAYSGSKGVDSIRDSVADYILARDGGERADIENIFLTSGASEGIKTIMQLATRSSKDGILIPTPQYPLYSATLTAIDAAPIGYSLIEKTGWKLDPAEIRSLCADARKKGIVPRALVCHYSFCSMPFFGSAVNTVLFSCVGRRPDSTDDSNR